MMSLLVTAMTLGELLGTLAGPYADWSISDLTLDSRDVRKGAAFVAVQGTQSHGLQHAEDALRRGAAIVLYEPQRGLTAPAPSLALPGLSGELGNLARRFFGRGKPQPSLFGVTGTNGKTTVAYLVAQAMHQHHTASSAYVGTLGYGRPPQLEPQGLTTPDCFRLHRTIYGLNAAHVALEVSSHALAQQRIAGLEFRTAALTNLSRDHLDLHGDMAAYGAAKRLLFDAPGLTHAVLNLDDSFAAGLLPDLRNRLRVVGTSLAGHPAANLRGQLNNESMSGLDLDVSYERQRAVLRTPLIGAFNAENLLVSLGALLAWDVPFTAACDALSRSAPAPGRMELVRAPNPPNPLGPCVVVDYAHTPAALERALTALRPLTEGCLWCVFGCGGERDAGKRPLMGAVAERLADHVVLTDDNPRREDPAAIVAAILQGFAAPERARIEHDRARAIAWAVGQAAPGDVVIIAGKGHESVQIGRAGSRPFSDRDAARLALEARS